MDADGTQGLVDRATRRLQGDLYLLMHWGVHGYDAAAAEACKRHGHLPRAGRCDRCGLGAFEMREEHFAGRR